MRKIIAALSGLLLAACAGSPVPVTPVQDFELEPYLGTWYEIARLDHSFERGLSNVTAEYSERDDGKIRVVNRGYNAEDDAWSEAVGKARFAENPSTGALEVSFFGPFYGDYIIFGLDEDYQTAYVSGGKDNFLWLLARTPTIDDDTRSDFIAKSDALGYETNGLIWVDQSLNIEAAG